jgi:hypothetical protein
VPSASRSGWHKDEGGVTIDMGLFTHLYKNHDREEWIRTVDSLVSVALQLITLAVQIYGLYWVTHHSR